MGNAEPKPGTPHLLRTTSTALKTHPLISLLLGDEKGNLKGLFLS